MKEWHWQIVLLCCIGFGIPSVYFAGKEVGHREKTCEPGIVVEALDHHKVICQFPDDKVEIRKY